MIVVLNKVDQLPEENRDKVISKAKKRLRQPLAATQFAGCAMVATAVKPGDSLFTCIPQTLSRGMSISSVCSLLVHTLSRDIMHIHVTADPMHLYCDSSSTSRLDTNTALTLPLSPKMLLDLHHFSATILRVHTGVAVTSAQAISLIRLAKLVKFILSLSVMVSIQLALTCS